MSRTIKTQGNYILYRGGSRVAGFALPDDRQLFLAAPALLAIVQYLADARRDGAQGAHFDALFSDDDITTLSDAVTAAIAKATQEEDR